MVYSDQSCRCLARHDAALCPVCSLIILWWNEQKTRTWSTVACLACLNMLELQSRYLGRSLWEDDWYSFSGQRSFEDTRGKTINEAISTAESLLMLATLDECMISVMFWGGQISHKISRCYSLETLQTSISKRECSNLVYRLSIVNMWSLLLFREVKGYLMSLENHVRKISIWIVQEHDTVNIGHSWVDDLFHFFMMVKGHMRSVKIIVCPTL